MHVLVACTSYPNLDGKKALYFVHVRNQYYMQNGIDVTVLNFDAKNNYTIDGIDVITLGDYESTRKKYDLLICHAPNIRNHYKFFKKHISNFKQIFLFFHGHEILKITREYPPRYSFVKNSVPNVIQNMYDFIKLYMWKNFITHNINKLILIFVSKTLYSSALKYTKLDEQVISDYSYIIHNSIGKIFSQVHNPV